MQLISVPFVVLLTVAGTCYSAATEEQELIELMNKLLREETDQRKGPGLTQEQKDKAVEVHNKLRSDAAKLGGANLNKLKWSDKLGELAQAWADNCEGKHRPESTYKPEDYGFKSKLGENIWSSTPNAPYDIPEKPIRDWHSEVKYFNNKTSECKAPPKESCGHYRMVMEDDVREVGCGFAKCPTMDFFVCNYGPFTMPFLPFKFGGACTKCDSGQFYCTDGLCDLSCTAAGTAGKCECKADCECGQKTDDCRCKCTPGWRGVKCNQECKDLSELCGGNPGFPHSWCEDSSKPYVKQSCPAFCGLCEKGNGTPCKGKSRALGEEIKLLIAALEKKQQQ